MKGKSEDKPSGSMWQEFETGILGCSIILKINSRIVELEFKQMGSNLNELNALLKSFGIIEEAKRTNKGKSKSASIQIRIEEDYGLNFYFPFIEQEKKAIIWLDKAVRLMEIVNIIKNNGVISFPR